MSDSDAMFDGITSLAERVQDLQRQAAQHYEPTVDQLLRSGSQDAEQIEHTLDGLLDFCGHEPVLQMFKRLCRHYWDIDPMATADYVNAYRAQWDSEEHQEHGEQA